MSIKSHNNSSGGMARASQRASSVLFAIIVAVLATCAIGALTWSSASAEGDDTEASASTAAIADAHVTGASVSDDDGVYDDTGEYVSAKADRSLVGDGALVPADAVTVTTTVVSSDFPGKSLDDLWSDPNGDGIADYWQDVLNNTLSPALLYKTSDDAQYYVGKIGNISDGYEFLQALGGLNDTSGTVYDDIKYDATTGLVYIPAQHKKDNGDKYDSVRVQLLYKMLRSDENADVNVKVEASNVSGELPSEGIASVNASSPSTSIKIAENIESENSIKDNTIDSVTVNGVKYPENTSIWSYDKDSGTLDINMSPVDIDSVKVDMSNTLGKDISRALGVDKADADNMLQTEWTVYGTPYFDSTGAAGSNGVALKGSEMMYEDTVVGDDDPDYPTTFGDHPSMNEKPGGGKYDNDCTRMVWDLLYRSGLAYDDLTVLYAYPNAKSQYNFRAWIEPQQAVINGVTYDIPGQRVALCCAHIGVSSTYETMADGNQQPRFDDAYKHDSRFNAHNSLNTGMWMHLLKVDEANQIITFGIVAPTINTQAGVGIFQVRYKQSKGYLEINKQSADETVTTNNGSYTLAGCSFGVYSDAECTNLVDTMTTDENGHAVSGQLDQGTYYIKEIGASNGYIIAQDTVSGDVVPGSTTTVGPISEQPEKGKITVVKKDEDTGKVIPDSTATFSLYSGADQSSMKKDQYLETLTLSNGTATTSKDYPLGEYYLVETKAPQGGYTIDKTPHNVTLSYAGQDVEVTTASIDVNNSPQKGTISFKKIDGDTNTALGGAVYDIMCSEDIVAPDGTVRVRKGDIVDTVTTGPDGIGTSKALYLGKYELHERNPLVMPSNSNPGFYAIDSSSFTATVDGDGVNIAESAGTVPEIRSINDDLPAEGQTVSAGDVIVYSDVYDVGKDPLALSGVELTNGNGSESSITSTGSGQGELKIGDKTYSISDISTVYRTMTLTDKADGKTYHVAYSFSISDDKIALEVKDKDAEQVIDSNKSESSDSTDNSEDADSDADDNGNGNDNANKNAEDNGNASNADAGDDSFGDEVLIGDAPSLSSTVRYSAQMSKDVEYISGEISAVNGEYKVLGSNDTDWRKQGDRTDDSASDGASDNKSENATATDANKKQSQTGASDSDRSDDSAPSQDPMDDAANADIAKSFNASGTITGECTFDWTGDNYIVVTYKVKVKDGVKDAKVLNDSTHYNYTYRWNNDVHYAELKYAGENVATTSDDETGTPYTNTSQRFEISKKDITGDEEVPGAHMALMDENGNVLERWVSTDEPHIILGLGAGTYILSESISPKTYEVAEPVTFTVENDGSVSQIAMKDEPIKITGEIDKYQTIATQENPYYEYGIDYRSTANVYADELNMQDNLECVSDDLARVDYIKTPVSFDDYDAKMNIWYKTNKTPADYADDAEKYNACSTNPYNPNNEGNKRVEDYTGWRLWKSDVSTLQSETLNVSDLGLADDEYITGLRMEHGRVEPGFSTRANDNSLWSTDRDQRYGEHDDFGKIQGTGDKFDMANAANAALATLGEHEYQPLIVGMHVTDKAFDEAGEENDLWNSAQMSIYRNGGGEEEILQDHDEDKVVQNIKCGALATTATVGDEKFDITAGASVDLVDKVDYKSLTPGVEYTLKGKLMDKQTGQPAFDESGNPIEAETTFTPDAPDGTVEVPFNFNARSLSYHDTVVFEQATTTQTPDGSEKLIAAHEDINDEGQTVHFGASDLADDLIQTGDVRAYAPIIVIIVAGWAAGIVYAVRRRRK